MIDAPRPMQTAKRWPNRTESVTSSNSMLHSFCVVPMRSVPAHSGFPGKFFAGAEAAKVTGGSRCAKPGLGGGLPVPCRWLGEIRRQWKVYANYVNTRRGFIEIGAESGIAVG